MYVSMLFCFICDTFMAQKTGQIRADISSEALAKHIIATVEGVLGKLLS
jgi:hypothetical protein